MIKPGEIQRKANTEGVRDTQIEKDYILSWILFGISKNANLAKALVFKGGTVLKKVYFEDYRFSEDLDFTLLSDHTNNQLKEWFNESFDFIKEEANIPLEVIDQNDHEDGGLNFYIQYIGPLGGIGANKKVKVDISRDETLVFDPLEKKVIVHYDDLADHKLQCYPLKEILVEKLRSTMQRMQPRDFYDIWYLLEVHEMDVDFFIPEFIQKCKSKGIDPNGFHSNLEKRLPQYEGRWKKSMSGQISDLPPFDQVQREVKRHLKKFNL